MTSQYHNYNAHRSVAIYGAHLQSYRIRLLLTPIHLYFFITMVTDIYAYLGFLLVQLLFKIDWSSLIYHYSF